MVIKTSIQAIVAAFTIQMCKLLLIIYNLGKCFKFLYFLLFVKIFNRIFFK